MAKRVKQRQTAVQKSENTSRSALVTPSIRASIFSLYITLTVVIVLGTAAWYRRYLDEPRDLADEVSSPLWRVMEIPGKGRGLIAIRNITQGTTVLLEKPLLLIPSTVRQSPEHLIASLVSQLSPEKRSQFEGLSHASNPDSTGDAQLLAKAQTNAISAGDKVGIFPRTAMLNHGCSSAFNVEYSWAEVEQQLIVQAFKPIKEGEELLTSYTDTKRPRDERRSYLQGVYGFTCSCAVCSLSPEESRRSDERLSEMSRLRTELGAWATGEVGGEEATKVINKIWSLGEEEGYWSERGSLAWDAVQVAAAHGQEDATRAWALVAEKWLAIELGPSSQQAKEAARIIHNPRSHPSWGSRHKSSVQTPKS